MIAMICAAISLAGVLVVSIPGVRGARAYTVMTLTAFAELICASVVAYQRIPDSTHYYWDRYFVVDASSVLFLSLISLVFMGSAIYALHRHSIGQMACSPVRYVRRSLLFFAASILAVLSKHLLMMWVFLELGTLAIAPLIFYGQTVEAKRASWKYLIFSIVGLGFNFLGLMCLARAMGVAQVRTALKLYSFSLTS